MHEIWSFPSGTPMCMPYLGFTYNGCHSSEFGLYRVSSGDRYVTDLTATNETKTVHIPGQEGSYYFGTEYKQKSFPINVAFDEITERSLMALQVWLSSGVTADLILDEKPYKAYYVKTEGMQNLSVIPFNRYNKNTYINETVYKGEGTIVFTCYQPFAHNTFKYLNQFKAGKGGDYFNLDFPKKIESNFEVDEWKNSVHLLESKEIEGTTGQELDGGMIKYDTSFIVPKIEGDKPKPMRIYNRYFNPGDFETYPYILAKIVLPKGTIFNGIRINKYSFDPIINKEVEDSHLVIYNENGFEAASNTQRNNFLIDTKTKNIQYWTDGGSVEEKAPKQRINEYINLWENPNGFVIKPNFNIDENHYFRLEVLKDGIYQSNGIEFDTRSELQVLYKYYYY